MKRRLHLIGIILMCVLFCLVPHSGHADASGGGWYLVGDTLHVTGNLGNYQVASSSSPYMTTTPFESAGILNQVNTLIVEEGVTVIGGLCFYGMRNLTNVSFPSTLEIIRGDAFMDCSSLRSVTIPKNVKKIGSYAFTWCNNLKTVIFEGDAPALDGYTYWFDGYSSTPPFSGNNTDFYYDSNQNWTSNNMRILANGGRWHDINIIGSGSCGDHASWTYSKQNILTISGSGELASYNSGTNTPWSAYNDEIISVVLTDGITSISSYTFEYMSNLQSVRLPATLQYLACNAFNDCHSLSSITIPASLTAFAGGQYFHRCNALTDIYYIGTEDEWQQIQNYQDCRASDSTVSHHFLTLHEANASTCVEAGHESYYSFSDSGNGMIFSVDKTPLPGIPYFPLLDHELTQHDGIEATCTNDGMETYWSCSLCEKLFSDLNASVEIDAPAIIPAMPHTLTEHARVEAACTAAGTEAYWSCSVCNKLFSDSEITAEIDEPVVIPAKGHTLVEHGMVEATYTSAGTEAYWECSVCNKLFANAAATITIFSPVVIPVKIDMQGNGWYLENNVLYITANLRNYHVASSSSPYMSTTPFEAAGILNQVQAIVVAEGVTEIGGLSFYGMNRAASVSLPSTLESIYGDAFMGCSRLTEITIPINVKRIGSYAFSDCFSLKKVIFVGDAPVLDGYSYWFDGYSSSPAFSGYNIDFYYDSNKNWTVSAMNRLAGYSAKWHDIHVVNSSACGESTLWTLKDDGTLTVSGTGNMDDYSSAPWGASPTQAQIMDGVTGIGGSAFRGCVSLTKITIPDSVTSIGIDAFNECASLTDVYFYGSKAQWAAISIEEGNDCLTGAAIHYSVFDYVLTLPASLTVIESEAFAGLANVDAVSIPATVTSIADGAFDAGIVIIAPAGSYAESWANDHGFIVNNP